MLVRSRGLTVLLIVLLASLILMSIALFQGRMIGQSSYLNVNWAAEFAQQLARGELYPRWLPGMNDGMGSPVFYFYGPLPFYLTAPIVYLTGDAGFSVVIGSTLMLAMSGISGYLLFRQFAGFQDSLVTAVIYMVMPYHFVIDIWGRAAYGEQAAFIFMPLASLCILKLRNGLHVAAGLALSCAGLAFSHLPSMLIFSPVMAFLSLWTAYQLRSFRVLAFAVSGGVLGIGAASIYLIPALTGRWFIKPEFWLLFRPEEQLLIVKFSETFDYILLLCFSLTAVVLAATTYLLRKQPDFRELHPWIAIGVAVLFLVSPFSAFIWRHAGVFAVVQFPWRVLSVMDLVSGVVIASYFRHLRATAASRPVQPVARTVLRLTLLVAGLAAGAAGVMRLIPVDDSAEFIEAVERENLAMKSDALEYLPSCMIVRPELVRGTVSTNLLLKDYRNLATPPSALRKFYYPFLHVYSEGRELPASCDPATGFVQVKGLSADASGVSVLRRPLPIERPAWIATLSSFFLIAVLAFASILRRHRPADRPG